MKRVLVVRTGSVDLAVRARLGDYTEWFARLLAPRVEVAFADGVDGPLPAPDAHDGVVVTGSSASVTAPAPWMDRLGAWLLLASAARPVLGVCFGHQLLARALDGRVERNPRGPEAGTAEVALTAAGRADPLFDGLPARFAAQHAHSDHVPAPPPGAVALAASALTPVQAFAHGPHLRAVQFHPEFDGARCRAQTEADALDLDRVRPGLAAAALRTVADTPDAERVLANWLGAYVRA